VKRARLALALALALLAGGCRDLVGIHQLRPDDGGIPIEITVRVSGGGRVVSLPRNQLPAALIDCPPTCTAIIPQGAELLLQAQQSNGSGMVFSAWGPPCVVTKRGECSLVRDDDTEVSASFRALEHNLVFVSSQTAPANLADLTRYDLRCNALASAAGINNLAGDAFIAWMSSTSQAAPQRLAGARGFERMDGTPLAETLDDPMAPPLHPVRFDERGVPTRDVIVRTGTTARGTSAQTCASWTSATPGVEATAGSPHAGPQTWVEGVSGAACALELPFYCVMRTETRPLAPVPEAGKLIFISQPEFMAGGGPAPADVLCQQGRPLGHGGTFKAVLATASAAAGAVLQPTQRYVRPDGVLVGTGAEIVAGTLRSGIWQGGDGRYRMGTTLVASGALTPGDPAMLANNCADWRDVTSRHIAGNAIQIDRFWSAFDVPCAQPVSVYCAEQ